MKTNDETGVPAPETAANATEEAPPWARELVVFAAVQIGEKLKCSGQVPAAPRVPFDNELKDWLCTQTSDIQFMDFAKQFWIRENEFRNNELRLRPRLVVAPRPGCPRPIQSPLVAPSELPSGTLPVSKEVI